MMDLLHEYKTWQTEERFKMGDRWNNSGKVFTQENGSPIHPDSITGWTKEFRETNKLPHFTPHALRHTSATLLIMSGVPVRAVAARLGHANQNTTNAIYSHTIQTVDALASDVIGDIIKLPGSSSTKFEVNKLASQN
jgi:integrase